MSDLSLEQRLAAAKAAKAEIERKRADRESKRAAEVEVLKAEREAKELAALEDAECMHGPVGTHIAVVETVEGIVIVKRPHPATFKKFQDAGKINSDTIAKFIAPCVVYPDAATFDALCDALAAVPMLCADAITSLAGARAKDQAGK